MEEVKSVQYANNKKIKTLSIKVLLVLLIVIAAFSSVWLFVLGLFAKDVALDFCRDACFVFSRKSVLSGNYIGGIPKEDIMGKTADDVSDKYGVVLEQRDKNDNLTGIYCDTSFAFFMLRDYDSENDRYVVYASMEDGIVTDVMLLNVERYAMLYVSTADNYTQDLSKDEINAYTYWNDNGGYSKLSEISKWEKYN